MFRYLWLMIMLPITAGAARGERLVTVTDDGWTVTADVNRSVLSIAHDSLGTVVKEVRLNLQDAHGLRPLQDWSVEKPGEHVLSIKTVQPPTAWRFDAGRNVLKISSTSTAGVLTAQVWAPPERGLARLLDPQGIPVSWEETDGFAKGYGGSETPYTSFLPQRNPECMYFALGQVASANLHSLFDRKADMAIDFSDWTLIQRNRQNLDWLDATIPVPGNTLIRLVPDYYTKTLGVASYVPFDDTYFRRPPAAWNSWPNYYGEVRERDIVRNADWIGDHLKPYGLEYVVLDAGYDGADNGPFAGQPIGSGHCWIGNWGREKFPHGPQWLANHIKSKGLRAGLWLVPNAYACALEQHPDWYLRYKDGKVVLDYRTPALDDTNPLVLTFLKKLFATLDDWGFEYYKFDGEDALAKYEPGVDLDRLYDKSIDPLVAYRQRLKLIRETIGPQRFIEGCPSGEPLDGIGYFNSYYTGKDTYASWQGNYVLFSSISATAFLNHLVVYLMPGEGIEIGPHLTVEEAKSKKTSSVVGIARDREDPMTGFGATLPEARTLVTYVSLTGVVYPVSSVMPELPEERVKLLKMTLPTMPIFPIDLFSRGTDANWRTFKRTTPDYYLHNFPEILDLKVNAPSGVYDVVGLTNWRSWTDTRELSFAEKLGLNPGPSYIVFDFWNQKLLGVFKDRMSVEIGPHDTRVLSIHPALNRPQLIGTSRHITGAYSILDLGWEPAYHRLHGSSETVPGDAYSFWVFLPKGVSVVAARAATKGGRQVAARYEPSGNALRVSFPGQPEPVDWEVTFADGSKP